MVSPGCLESGKKTRREFLLLSYLSGVVPSVTLVTVNALSRSMRMTSVGIVVFATIVVVPEIDWLTGSTLIATSYDLTS